MSAFINKYRSKKGGFLPKVFHKKSNTISDSFETGYKHKVNDLPQKHQLTKQEYTKAIRGVLKEASEALINEDGGVVLDRVGYLCNWASPNKIPGIGIKSDFLYSNLDNNSWRYTPAIFTKVFDNNRLEGWSMEGGFTEKVIKSIYNSVNHGKKYKLFYRMVVSLYRSTPLSYKAVRRRRRQLKLAEHDDN